MNVQILENVNQWFVCQETCGEDELNRENKIQINKWEAPKKDA